MLVSRQVIHHDHLAGPQGGSEHVLHKSKKDAGVGRSVDGHASLDSCRGERSQNGQHSPAPVGDGFADALAFRGPSIKTCQVGADPAFIDKYEIFGWKCC